MSVLRIETSREVLLNTILLFAVSIEPYALNLMWSGNPSLRPSSQDALSNTASMLFGVDVGVLMSITGLFYQTLSKDEKLEPKALRSFRISRDSRFFIAVMFFVSALPQFWTVGLPNFPLRFMIWTATVPFVRTTRFFERRRDRKKPETEKYTA